MKQAFYLLALSLIVLTSVPSVQAAELELGRPEDVGMSSEKLARITPMLQEFVDQKKVPGAIAIVARHGKIIYFDNVGRRDIDADKPMERDSILRFYSMTKPITSVAVMMLVEEGRLDLDAPVSTYIPSWQDLKVFGDGSNESPKRQMVVRDLLRHTSGLSYGFFGDSPVDEQYKSAMILSPTDDLKETIVGTLREIRGD